MWDPPRATRAPLGRAACAPAGRASDGGGRGKGRTPDSPRAYPALGLRLPAALEHRPPSPAALRGPPSLACRLLLPPPHWRKEEAEVGLRRLGPGARGGRSGRRWRRRRRRRRLMCSELPSPERPAVPAGEEVRAVAAGRQLEMEALPARAWAGLLACTALALVPAPALPGRALQGSCQGATHLHPPTPGQSLAPRSELRVSPPWAPALPSSLCIWQQRRLVGSLQNPLGATRWHRHASPSDLALSTLLTRPALAVLRHLMMLYIFSSARQGEALLASASIQEPVSSRRNLGLGLPEDTPPVFPAVVLSDWVGKGAGITLWKPASGNSKLCKWKSNCSRHRTDKWAVFTERWPIV